MSSERILRSTFNKRELPAQGKWKKALWGEEMPWVEFSVIHRPGLPLPMVSSWGCVEPSSRSRVFVRHGVCRAHHILDLVKFPLSSRLASNSPRLRASRYHAFSLRIVQKPHSLARYSDFFSTPAREAPGPLRFQRSMHMQSRAE